MSPGAPGIRQFYKMGMRLIDAAKRRPSQFDDRAELRDSAHHDLIETLLRALDSGKETARTRNDRTRQSYSAIVKTVANFVLDRVDERPLVADLCEATDVSERTLQYAFKDILGLSPTAYLARLRLHRARSELRLASPRSTTVTAVALNWGFWHFGDFSKSYALCFGEPPSMTLRR
jgi:transcriptional regulator GlxA family with amidase domain